MKNKIWILTFVLLLNGCAQFEPFEDTRREAGKIQPVGQSSPQAPAICYNPIWHDLSDTKELAQATCTKTGKNAVYIGTNHFSCRLVNPSTAIYRCE